MMKLENTKDAKQELPNGWRWVSLGEVGIYWNGRAFKPEEWREEGIPIIRIENLNTPKATYNHFQGEVLPRHQINNGDLLVSWSATLDAYIWNQGPAVLNQHIFKVEEKTQIIHRNYFYQVLKHTMARIRERVQGATMKHITKPEFEQIEIPLPPLHEQRRIAGILKEQMAAVDKARAAAQARLEAVKALPAAFLRQVFPQPGQPLPHGWRWVKLGEVCNRIRNGTTANQMKAISDIPVTRIETISSGEIDPSKVGYLSNTENNYSEYLLEPGDILFSHINSVERLGNCAIYRGTPINLIHGMNLLRIQSNRRFIDPDFLLLIFRSESAIAFYRNEARRAIGQASLNTKDISTLSIPLPPLSDQQRIAEMLKVHMAAVDKVRGAAEKELQTINALPVALLRRAFSGEL